MLLSNSARDMQQVLLAGGPYPADGLVSSLEMCARRSGASLPAIGQLTFDHLAPLQKFVNEHCSASKVNICKQMKSGKKSNGDDLFFRMTLGFTTRWFLCPQTH